MIDFIEQAYRQLYEELERQGVSADLTVENAHEWTLSTWAQEASTENGFSRKICGRIDRLGATRSHA